MKTIRMEIRSTQNVGRVLISRKEKSWPFWGHLFDKCSMGKTSEKNDLGGPIGSSCCYLPLVEK